MKKINIKPSVTVLSGTPLTGKTTLAEKLIAISNLEMIDVDIIREEIDETRKLDPSQRWLPPDQELAIMVKSYTLLCQRAIEETQAGRAIIITGTFSRDVFKQPLEELYKLAQEKGIPFRPFLLTTTDEEAEKRIKKRKKEGSASNVDTLEKYQWSGTIFSPIAFAPLAQVDTGTDDYAYKVLEHLSDLIVNKAS